MANIKSLAKETAIYGVSSILGKFLNWLLVPLYTYVLESSADADADQPVRMQMRDILSVKDDLPLLGMIKTGDAIQ